MKRTKCGLHTAPFALCLLALSATSIVGIAVRPAQAQILYAADFTSQNLYRVSTTNAALTLVGNTGVSLGSLAYRPSNGFLYGFTVGSDAALYRVNPANASTTFVGSLGEFVFEGGMVIAPNGTVYAANKNTAATPTLFTINLDTGATTNVGVIPGTHDINGLAWRSDNMLVGLDRESNALLAINPSTAVSSVIAPLSITVGSLGGMAAIGDNGFFSNSPPGSNSLFTFNLFTGANSLIGSFAPTITGAGIGDLALVPVPEPSSGLLAATALAAFTYRRRKPMRSRLTNAK